MDFYSANVIFFVAVNAGLSYRQYKQQDGKSKIHKEAANGGSVESVAASDAANWHFKMKFLPVYLLVFGADWLQVCATKSTVTSLRLTDKGTLYLHYV